jgi:hypothetical protein
MAAIVTREDGRRSRPLVFETCQHRVSLEESRLPVVLLHVLESRWQQHSATPIPAISKSVDYEAVCGASEELHNIFAFS